MSPLPPRLPVAILESGNRPFCPTIGFMISESTKLEQIPGAVLTAPALFQSTYLKDKALLD
jgi:hypothetical protein